MVLPRAVVFGEALTDLVQGTPGQWQGYPGGAPWNVARALSRLGVGSAFAGSVSTDSLGDEIARQTEAAGLDMRFLQRVDRDPLVAIVPSSRPPRYFFAGEADLFFDPAAAARMDRAGASVSFQLHQPGSSAARRAIGQTRRAG